MVNIKHAPASSGVIASLWINFIRGLKRSVPAITAIVPNIPDKTNRGLKIVLFIVFSKKIKFAITKIAATKNMLLQYTLANLVPGGDKNINRV